MEKKEIKVYKFEELDDKTKEKVIERFREEEEHFFLKDALKIELEEILNKRGYIITNIKPYYDLSYSQGSGFMFEGVIEKNNITYKIRHSGFYYHYNSKEIEAYNTDYEEIDTTEFNEEYITICKELEKYGYSIIEAALKEENIIETIEANDYLFFYNGEIANQYIENK